MVHQGLAQRRLVGNLALARAGLGSAHEGVDALLAGGVLQVHDMADRDAAALGGSGDNDAVGELLLEHLDAVLVGSLLVLGVVVLRVLGQVAEVAGHGDGLGDALALGGLAPGKLLLKLELAFGGKHDCLAYFHGKSPCFSPGTGLAGIRDVLVYDKCPSHMAGTVRTSQ